MPHIFYLVRGGDVTRGNFYLVNVGLKQKEFKLRIVLSKDNKVYLTPTC